jgi:hypothetical protein
MNYHFIHRLYLHHIKTADFNYRIYSRISREILVRNLSLFYPFDLYAGHKKLQLVFEIH